MFDARSVGLTQPAIWRVLWTFEKMMELVATRQTTMTVVTAVQDDESDGIDDFEHLDMECDPSFRFAPPPQTVCGIGSRNARASRDMRLKHALLVGVQNSESSSVGEESA